MEYEDILNEAKRLSKKKTKKKGRPKKNEGTQGGYITVKDLQGNSVAKHRYLKAKELGRALRPYEIVTFKDKDRTNFALDNLILGLKAGTNIQELECPHCGKDLFTEDKELL